MDLEEIRSILVILAFLVLFTTLIFSSPILWFIWVVLLICLLFLTLRINKIKEDEKLNPSTKGKAAQLNKEDKAVNAVKIILIAITFVVFLFAIYRFLSPASNEYTNSDYHFSLVYPNNWRVLEGYMGTVVTVALPGQNDLPVALCIVMTKTVSPSQSDIRLYGKTLEEYAKLQGYNLTSDNYTTVNGEEVYDYSMTQASDSGLTVSQNRVLIRNGNSYLIGCSSDQADFNNYKPDFDSVINSFRFTG